MTEKTVVLHGVPPWAPSGYGVQMALLAEGLRAAGYNVILSIYGGFIMEGRYWNDFQILSCGGTSKGVGRIAYNYERAKADVLITVCDLWPLDAREFKGLNVISWLPVDTSNRIGMPDRIQLAAARELCSSFRPVAMSRHGQQLLEAEGFAAYLVPHMVAGNYKTGDRHSWRAENGISPSAFLVSTVGVNGDFPCRKGFPELLAAWQPFAEAHPSARLYMHTQQSPGVEGVDLIEIAKSLGIRNSVGWPDQLKRLSDLHSADYMAGMYRASDAAVFASLGEGFCVPALEAMACGTPVIASAGSALVDRVTPETGVLVATQPAWSKLHQAWWHLPLVPAINAALEDMFLRARTMRRAAKLAAAPYRAAEVIPAWCAILETGLGEVSTRTRPPRPQRGGLVSFQPDMPRHPLELEHVAGGFVLVPVPLIP